MPVLILFKMDEFTGGVIVEQDLPAERMDGFHHHFMKAHGMESLADLAGDAGIEGAEEYLAPVFHEACAMHDSGSFACAGHRIDYAMALLLFYKLKNAELFVGKGHLIHFSFPID